MQALALNLGRHVKTLVGYYCLKGNKETRPPFAALLLPPPALISSIRIPSPRREKQSKPIFQGSTDGIRLSS
jgi:hypothetical protein